MTRGKKRLQQTILCFGIILVRKHNYIYLPYRLYVFFFYNIADSYIPYFMFLIFRIKKLEY